MATVLMKAAQENIASILVNRAINKVGTAVFQAARLDTPAPECLPVRRFQAHPPDVLSALVHVIPACMTGEMSITLWQPILVPPCMP